MDNIIAREASADGARRGHRGGSDSAGAGGAPAERRRPAREIHGRRAMESVPGRREGGRCQLVRPLVSSAPLLPDG